MPVVRGRPQWVRAQVEQYHAQGRLVSMTPPVPIEHGRVAMRIELRPQQPPARVHARRVPAPAARPWWTRPRPLAGGIAALGAVTWAGYIIVTWIAAHWATILGALVLVTVVVAALLRLAGSSGGHCSGPNTGHGR